MPVEGRIAKTAIVELDKFGRVRIDLIRIDFIDDQFRLGGRRGESADRERCCSSAVAGFAVQCIGTAEGPVGQGKGTAIRPCAADPVRPAIEVVPGLPGSVDIDVAKYVGDSTVPEQLDRVVTVDTRGRPRYVIGREAEKVVKRDSLGCDVNEIARGCCYGRESKLLAIAAAAIIGTADAKYTQVCYVADNVDLDSLWNATGQRTVNNATDDQFLGGNRMGHCHECS